MSRDYKETLLLPKPEFSIRGVKDEAAIRETFTYDTSGEGLQVVLHDGPPYANGDIHMGHAMNKILKDIFLRQRRSMGNKTHFVPGWDCHGLPIEWQIEKDLIANGQSKADFTPVEFRALCRDYATHWIKTQREQFKALGVLADWDNPYLTMDFASEGKIVQAFHNYIRRDMLYKDRRPVLWSVVEGTALAEAETDYETIKASSVYVRFPVVGEDASVVI